MLEKITWGQYWTVVGGLATFYYAGILAVFYGDRLRRGKGPQNTLMERRGVDPMGPILQEESTMEGQESPEAAYPTEEGDPNTPVLDLAEKFATLVTGRLGQLGAGNATDREKVLSAVRPLLAELNGEGYLTLQREAIDWFLTQAAQDHCGITLDGDDLDRIWHP